MHIVVTFYDIVLTMLYIGFSFYYFVAPSQYIGPSI
jgi:hypothetical protein